MKTVIKLEMIGVVFVCLHHWFHQFQFSKSSKTKTINIYRKCIIHGAVIDLIWIFWTKPSPETMTTVFIEWVEDFRFGKSARKINQFQVEFELWIEHDCLPCRLIRLKNRYVSDFHKWNVIYSVVEFNGTCEYVVCSLFLKIDNHRKQMLNNVIVCVALCAVCTCSDCKRQTYVISLIRFSSDSLFNYFFNKSFCSTCECAECAHILASCEHTHTDRIIRSFETSGEKFASFQMVFVQYLVW